MHRLSCRISLLSVNDHESLLEEQELDTISGSAEISSGVEPLTLPGTETDSLCVHVLKTRTMCFMIRGQFNIKTDFSFFLGGAV